jgi:hypothetical protein
VIGIVQALRLQIGSRVASLRDPLADLHNFLATSRFVLGIAGMFEIGLSGWILFQGVSRVNGTLLLAFAVYFVFLIVYGIAGLAGHQAVYNTIGHYLLDIVPPARKAAGAFNAVSRAARDVYPFPVFDKRRQE